MRRLVNEKTLELNITYELMRRLDVQIYGLTQHEEGFIGADVEYYSPLGVKYVIQFKAARKGNDGTYGVFELNNNQNMDQHLILDMIDKSGVIRAFYLFPLVITDNFLVNNFGRLLVYTVPIKANQITGNLNWRNLKHKISVYNNGQFFVTSSKKHYGESKSMNSFIEDVKNNIKKSKILEMTFPAYIKKTIRKIEEMIREKGIIGRRKFTFLFFGRSENTQQIGFYQTLI